MQHAGLTMLTATAGVPISFVGICRLTRDASEFEKKSTGNETGQWQV